MSTARDELAESLSEHQAHMIGATTMADAFVACVRAILAEELGEKMLAEQAPGARKSGRATLERVDPRDPVPPVETGAPAVGAPEPPAELLVYPWGAAHGEPEWPWSLRGKTGGIPYVPRAVAEREAEKWKAAHEESAVELGRELARRTEVERELTELRATNERLRECVRSREVGELAALAEFDEARAKLEATKVPFDSRDVPIPQDDDGPLHTAACALGGVRRCDGSCWHAQKPTAAVQAEAPKVDGADECAHCKHRRLDHDGAYAKDGKQCSFEGMFVCGCPEFVEPASPPPRLDASIVTAASVSSATDAMRGSGIGGGRRST